MVAPRRHTLPQRGEHAAPRAHQPRGVAAVVGASLMVEKDHGIDGDPHRMVERHAEPPGHRMELRMRADAGAAAGQLLAVALENLRIEADAAQHVGGEQAADRTADDDGATGHACIKFYWVIRSSSAISS